MIRISASMSEPFQVHMERKRRVLEGAVTAGIRAAGEGLLIELRQEIGRTLGERAGNMVGLKVFPERQASLAAAASVFPRGARADAILTGHREGATVRPRFAGGLAIPTENVPLTRGRGRGGGRRMTPVEVEAAFNRELRAVPVRRGRLIGLLVMDELTPSRRLDRRGRRRFRSLSARRRARGRTGESVVMFFIVRDARLKKRLNPDAIAQRWGDRVPELIDLATPTDI